MNVWMQVKVRGRGLDCAAYRLYARSVCDAKAPLQLQYATRGALQLIYLCLCQSNFLSLFFAAVFVLFLCVCNSSAPPANARAVNASFVSVLRLKNRCAMIQEIDRLARIFMSPRMVAHNNGRKQ